MQKLLQLIRRSTPVLGHPRPAFHRAIVGAALQLLLDLFILRVGQRGGQRQANFDRVRAILLARRG